MLLEKIKSDQLNARKSKNSIVSALLTTLYSEAINVGKNDGNRFTSEEEVLATIKKFIKSALENKEIYSKSGNLEKLEVIEQELSILKGYLPEQVSPDLVSQAILEICRDLSLPLNNASMGRIMKELKLKFSASLDGAAASLIIKELIQKA